MRLDDALSDIQFIQASISTSQRAVCFRWATTLTVAGLALVAGSMQSGWVNQPLAQPGRYFQYWVATALLAVAIVSVEIFWRYLYLASPLQRKQTRESLVEFLPSLLVGGSVSLVGLASVPKFVVLLPAIWMAFIAMGIFALRLRLPRSAMLVGLFYVATALASLVFIDCGVALSGWYMGGSFAFGNSMMAYVLYGQQARISGG